jgi:trans-aconitate 2-methyltransferase
MRTVDGAAESYLFGDSELAARRLRLLAEVFAESTRELCARLAAYNPRKIVDVGCGPGYTTRLLAEVFSQARVLGIDSSSRFIEIASQIPTERVEYWVADAAQLLPGGSHDLIYSRYLLTHIANPREVIARWSDALSDGGLIVIEENEWIHTTVPAFSKYLEIVAAMLAQSGQRLYIGAELAAEPLNAPLSEELSEVVPIPARDVDAAGMFLMNIPSWRHQPFIEQNLPKSELDALVNDLEQIAQGDPAPSSIEFGRRRLVLIK